MSARKETWWYSPDERTGFCWQDVKGFDWHPANGGTAFADYIYVYLGGGILRITGDSARQILVELTARKAKAL